MIDVAYICIGWALLVIGTLGCFISVLPGPPLAYLALVLAHLTGDHSSPTISTLVVSGVVTAVVTVLDYIVPSIGAKKFNCSKAGTWGCLVGTVVGLFFMPFGVILGPFLGALTGEIIAGKRPRPALRGAVGALLGYVAGIVLKLICCGFLGVVFWKATCG